MFRFLEASRGKISHVVVYKFDRFSRNVDDGAEYRMRLRKMGVTLLSATEKTDDTPAGSSSSICFKSLRNSTMTKEQNEL